MRFVLASYGTRGDIEPSVVVGRELQRRGHDVCIAVPPDLVDFAESAGLTAVPYGAETRVWLDVFRNFFTSVFSTFWRMRDLSEWGRELWKVSTGAWVQMNETLTSLADGADLLFTTIPCEQAAANVAEHYGIPLVTLHYYPVRPNGRLIPLLPGPIARFAM
ncbi:glycosyltransferase, partial [Mycobacterium sp. 1245852.3]|uniref:glycosyltransferase n=1 Tax=Mycobacterium sp. 1245852.3 TaxID=1856860 RepID=UPI000ABCE7F6